MDVALFIVLCLLSLIAVIIYTFVSSAIHKRDLCRKSPYYHCDTSWQCCKTANCDTAPNGPTSANSYFLTDQLYGSNKGGTLPSGSGIVGCGNSTAPGNLTYYEACIEPIKLVNASLKATDPPIDFSCLYDSAISCPVAITNVISVSPGQCCYQKFDLTGTQLYPSSSTKQNGNWTSGAYGNPYNISGDIGTNYVYPPGSGKNTVDNSCNNSLYGGPRTANSYGYDGCPN